MISSGIRILFDYVFGYDFFISYTWVNGGGYAKELHRSLIDQGFTVFLDRQEFAAGDNWSFMARRAIRKTRKLIVIATPDIHQSTPVAEEVSAFAKTGRRIIAIELDDGLSPARRTSSPLAALTDPHLLIVRGDNTDDIPSGPSRDTITRLVKDFTQLRQTERRMRILAFTSLILILLLISAVLLAVESIKQRNVAKSASDRAIASSKAANLNLAAAQWQRGNALRGKPYGTDEPAPILGSWNLLEAAAAFEKAGELQRVPNALLASSSANQNLIATALQPGVDRFVEDELGKRILSWGGQEIRLWNAETLSPLGPPIAAPSITEAHFTPDEKGIVGVGKNQTITLWEIASGKRLAIRTAPKAGASALPPSQEEIEGGLVLQTGFQAVFSTDRVHFLTIGEDGTVTLWKSDTLELVGKPVENDHEPIVRFSEDGSLYLILTENHLGIRSTTTGQEVFATLDLNGTGNTAMFRLKHKEVLVATGDHFQVLDSESGAIKQDTDLKSQVMDIQVSADEKLIFLRTSDKRIILDGSESIELVAIPKTDLEVSEFSSTHSILAGYSNPGDTVHFWDTSNGELVSETSVNLSSSNLWGGNTHGKFDVDGTEIVANTMDTSVVGRWNVQSGESVGIPMTHIGTISQFGFLKNGGILTTSAESGDLRLWRKHHAEAKHLVHEGSMDQLDFSADGRRVISRANESVKLWDVQNQKEIPSALSGEKGVYEAAFNAESNRLLLKTHQKISLWNAVDGALINAAIPSVGITKLAFLPDGRSFVSFDKHSIQLRESASGTVLFESKVQGCSEANIRDDGRYLWGTYDDKGDGILWEIANNTLRLAATLPVDSLSSAAFSPDRRFLALAGTGGLYLWDLEKLVLKQLDKESDNTHHLLFSPDSTKLMEYNYRSRSSIWDISSGKCLRETQDGPAKACFTPDSSFVLGNGGERIFLWRCKDGTDADESFPTSSVHDIKINPSSGEAVVPLGQTLFVFETKIGKWVPRLRANQDITSISFSPDGRIAVTTGKAKATYQCWDFHAGRILFPELRHQSFVDTATFAPTGSIIITNAQDKTIRLWDAVNGALITSIVQDDDLLSVKLSPDGKHFATFGETDGDLEFWKFPDSGSADVIRNLKLELEARSATTPSSDGKIRMLDAEEYAARQKAWADSQRKSAVR